MSEERNAFRVEARAHRSHASFSRLLARASLKIFAARDGSDRIREWGRLTQTQWRTFAEQDAEQLSRLNVQLDHAWRTVPYYKALWKSHRPLAALNEIEALPIVTKTMVREAGAHLLSREFQRHRLLSAKTGGSTGTSLVLFFDHVCQQHRNAAALRSDSWAGWSPGDWVGALWGSPERPASTTQKLRNWLCERQEYLDTMRLDSTSMNDFLALMRSRRLGALFGHAHSLYILADFLEKSGAKVPAPHAIVSTSMMLIPSERQVIERAFGCPVTDRYGCEEVGLIAAECERHTGLHVNAEHTLVEVVDEAGQACAPGEIGRVLVTDLENLAMPLIRYEVGDLSAWAANPCACGRGLRTLERVVGRQADCLVRTDGSLVAGVSLVERTLTAIPGMHQLQIEQQTPRLVVARAVFDPTSSARTSLELHDALARDLGAGISITVEQVARIPQERNGKYRFAIRRF